MTSVFTTEALEQVLVQAAGYRTGYERLEAGEALQAAGRTGARAYLDSFG